MVDNLFIKIDEGILEYKINEFYLWYSILEEKVPQISIEKKTIGYGVHDFLIRFNLLLSNPFFSMKNLSVLADFDNCKLK